MASRLPDILTEPEFKRLINNTYKSHYKTAFYLGFTCGLRVSEVVNLKEKDIDRGRQAIKIVQGKGGKDRYVYYSKKLTPHLKHIPLGVGVRALQKSLKLAVKRASINKDIHFHTLRHSFASLMLKKGMTLKEVQQMMGHANISTTSVYLHVSDEDLKKKVEEIW